MKYVYEDENLRISEKKLKFIPEIKRKGFIKFFNYWTTICTSQVNDTPIGAKNLEDAIILGNYFNDPSTKKEQEKRGMDLSEKVVEEIIKKRKYIK